MEIFMQRKNDFLNALDRLMEALNTEINDLAIDGILHRFEFTFELSWKMVKDYLEYLGLTEKTGSPREVIQLGFKQGIIEDGEMWIQMMLSRNLLSHLYNEDTSREIYEKIKNEYIDLFVKLKDKFENI